MAHSPAQWVSKYPWPNTHPNSLGLQVPMARASILWLIGEYCEHVPRLAPDVLRKMAQSFTAEEDIVKLQTINLAAKLYLTNSKQVEGCPALSPVPASVGALSSPPCPLHCSGSPGCPHPRLAECPESGSPPGSVKRVAAPGLSLTLSFGDDMPGLWLG